CTSRQKGALLRGWVLARAALVSLGSGTGAATTLAGGSKRGAALSWACTVVHASKNKHVAIRLRMISPASLSLRLQVFVLELRPGSGLVVPHGFVARLVPGSGERVVARLPDLLVRLAWRGGLDFLGASSELRQCSDGGNEQNAPHDFVGCLGTGCAGVPCVGLPYAVPQPQTSLPLPRFSTRVRKMSATTSPSPPSSALVEHISAQAGSLPSDRRLRPYFSYSASLPLAAGPPAQKVRLSILPRKPKVPLVGHCGARKGPA